MLSFKPEFYISNITLEVKKSMIFNSPNKFRLKSQMAITYNTVVSDHIKKKFICTDVEKSKINC